MIPIENSASVTVIKHKTYMVLWAVLKCSSVPCKYDLPPSEPESFIIFLEVVIDRLLIGTTCLALSYH